VQAAYRLASGGFVVRRRHRDDATAAGLCRRSRQKIAEPTARPAGPSTGQATRAPGARSLPDRRV